MTFSDTLRLLTISIVSLFGLPLAGVAQTDTTNNVLLALGDIAKCRVDRFESLKQGKRVYKTDGKKVRSDANKTAELIRTLPGTILILGDLAYRDGTKFEFQECFGRVWKDLKQRSRPSPGNHEYHTSNAMPYYDYWGPRAGKSGLGYYSFDKAGWHIISLNSSKSGKPGRPQYKWLEQDLAATKARCILAYWHHPVFSSSKHGNSRKMQEILKLLYRHRASVVLAGHDHTYERFAPLNPKGRRDPGRGVRLFTVGTGGGGLYKVRKPQPASETYTDENYGVLRLELLPTSYSWKFIPATGPAYQDAGTASCIERPGL